MKIINLGEIANIDISNVEKKIKDTDSPVVLCNFVDVYHNWAITNDLLPNLMKSTANENQISRFSIRKGQVAITKDSETRDDIGVSTYIADNISNGVLGYHCALITPDESILTGKYLNVVLHTPYAQKYFELNASGSGQRYTLTVDIIAGFPVPVPDIETQRIVGDFYSAIDQKITTNNRINAELESMAKTIYDYWFTQFDFPDENGKPYKSSGGKMVWNEELKREIPEGWKVVNLESFINVIRGVSYSPDEVSTDPKENYVPLLKSNNLQNGRLILDDIIYVPKANVADNQYLSNNSVFVTMSSGSTEHVGKTALIPFDTEYCYGAFCSKIEIKPEFRCFISCFFLSDYFKRLIRTIVIGTSIKNISNEHLTNNLIAIPANTDNYIINGFERIISPFFDKQAEIIKENQQLASLRDWLLPMLMNGQVGFEGELIEHKMEIIRFRGYI